MEVLHVVLIFIGIAVTRHRRILAHACCTIYDSNFTLQNSQTLHADRCQRVVHVFNNCFDVAGEPIHEYICLVNRERDMHLQNEQK